MLGCRVVPSCLYLVLQSFRQRIIASLPPEQLKLGSEKQSCTQDWLACISKKHMFLAPRHIVSELASP